MDEVNVGRCDKFSPILLINIHVICNIVQTNCVDSIIFLQPFENWPQKLPQKKSYYVLNESKINVDNVCNLLLNYNNILFSIKM